MVTRRGFVAAGVVMASTAMTVEWAASPGVVSMYGLISKVHAVPGQRGALISILVDGAAGMPGCLSYVVAHDLTNPDAIWITEDGTAKRVTKRRSPCRRFRRRSPREGR